MRKDFGRGHPTWEHHLPISHPPGAVGEAGQCFICPSKDILLDRGTKAIDIQKSTPESQRALGSVTLTVHLMG